jgi:hypothetical protein
LESLEGKSKRGLAQIVEEEMNYSRILIAVVEFFCVAILSLCGIVAFSNSGLYTGFAKSMARFVPSAYLSFVLFLILLAFGLFYILIRNRGAGILTVAVIILSLPSIFSYNNIDLLRIFGGSGHITTRISLFQMMSIGFLIIAIYFLLDLINKLKTNSRRSRAQQTPSADFQSVSQHQFLISAIFTGGALLFCLVITAAARGFEYFISKNTLALSWWIVPVALFCILVLGIYLRWVTTRKNS